MGICASSSRNQYSPTVSSTCSPQHVASHGNLASSGGNRITSVDQLNSTERKRFLEQQDCGFHDYPDTHSTNIRTLIPC